MPTRKIDPEPVTPERLDPNERRNFCQHPEHDPPAMQVFKPGTYEHTCPGCGHKGKFIVRSDVRMRGE